MGLWEYGLLSELLHLVVGIEAKVVCTKKTIRCCTTYFRGHGESLRSFCTRECRKVKSEVEENCIRITLLYEKWGRKETVYLTQRGESRRPYVTDASRLS